MSISYFVGIGVSKDHLDAFLIIYPKPETLQAGRRTLKKKNRT
ncbi:MAG: hypothetical protein ACFCD0_20580 [Gemmataceae bacterium]